MTDFPQAATSGGTRLTVFGVIAIILGMLAMLMPGLTGLSVVTLVGVLVVGGGIVRMLWAFGAESLGTGLLVFALGGLTLLCGLVLVANPLVTAGVLTILLGGYFVLDGIAEIVAGLRRRPERGWGWLLFGGIVSLWLGLLMWGQFPLAGAWAIGILLGIKLVFVGLLMLLGGAAVRAMTEA